MTAQATRSAPAPCGRPETPPDTTVTGAAEAAPAPGTGSVAAAAPPALIALARALGRDAARRHVSRRAHSTAEVALLLLLATAILATALALGGR